MPSKIYLPDKEPKKRVVSPLIFPAIIFIFGILIYANSLRGEFIWDDEHLIRNNEAIKSLRCIPDLFTGNIGSGAGVEYPYYRPLFMMTLAMDYVLWGLATPGYHFTTVLIHAFVALAIYWLIRIIFNNQLTAFLTGMLFVVHPTHTEDVAYITGRADSLAVLFLLLAFIFYLKYLESGTVRNHLFFTLFFIIALLCKETVVIFSGLILAYHLAFRILIKWRSFLTILAITLIYLFGWFFVFHASLAKAKYSTTIVERIPGFFAAVASYMRLLAHPFDLHMEYPDRTFPWGHPVVMGGFLIMSIFLATAWKFRKTYPTGTYAVSWFFISLLPVSNIFYPASSYMAERYLYLPSIGVFFFLAHLFSVLWLNDRYKIPAALCVSTAIILFAVLTIRQNNYWREPVFFYQRTLEYSPDSARARNNLAIEYEKMGRTEDALKEYQQAIKSHPAYGNAYYNVGVLYTGLGKYDEAVRFYQKAIQLNPAFAKAHYNLGAILEKEGKFDEALASFRKAHRYGLRDARVFNKIGMLMKEAGKYDEAAENLRSVLPGSPGSAEAFNNLGIVYKSNGEFERALGAYRKSIEINPAYADAYYNMGSLLVALGRSAEAADFFKEAIKLKGDYAAAYNNLAVAYKNLGDIDSAIQVLHALIRVKPDYAEGYYNLALLYYHTKEYGQAVEYCDLAGQNGKNIDPRFSQLLENYRDPRPTEK